MNVGLAIKNKMKAKKITVKNMTERLGVTRQAVNYYFERKHLNTKCLTKVCLVIGVLPSEIMLDAEILD